MRQPWSRFCLVFPLLIVSVGCVRRPLPLPPPSRADAAVDASAPPDLGGDLGAVVLAADLAPVVDLAPVCSPPPRVVLNAARDIFSGLAGFLSTGGTVLATADFNHDGILDLVTNDTGIALGQGQGQFGAPVIIGDSTGAMSVADLDGDGNLDLVGLGKVLEVWLGRGDGTFGPVLQPRASSTALARRAGRR